MSKVKLKDIGGARDNKTNGEDCRSKRLISRIMTVDMSEIE